MSKQSKKSRPIKQLLASVALAGGLALLLLLQPGLLIPGSSGPAGGVSGLGSSFARAQPSPPEQLRFRSRPDLSVPAVEVDVPARRAAPGYVFMAPKSDGPMIVDNRGNLVWYREGKTSNFRAQKFRGKPVLTWWEAPAGNQKRPTYVIADKRYRTIRRFKAGNGYGGDLHEFLLLPNGHAMITAYYAVDRDLSSLGGRSDGVVLDSIAQEVDVDTGRVVWEWHSLDHVPLRESFHSAAQDPDSPYDYFHINSVSPTPDGNVLISGRDTWTVYKVSRHTGKIIWRLGGKRSDFRLGKGAKFAWQHDADLESPRRLALFDNRDAPPAPKPFSKQSRGLVLRLKWGKRRATVQRRYVRPESVLATTQGNIEKLSNGNVFVGWGSVSYCSEFSPKGKVLFDAEFLSRDSSYRCFRMPWVGRPAARPAIASEDAAGGTLKAWASWNGDTRVATWRLLAGPSKKALDPVGTARRNGFETAVTAKAKGKFVQMEGLARNGAVLGRTAVTRVGEQSR
ncbi:MAG: arylsulfotransferase family protein [Solirubrobacterales bacterium]